MNHSLIRKYSVFICTLITIVIYLVAVALPLNRPSDEILAQYPVLINPARFALAIVSLIHLGLLTFTAYHFVNKNKDRIFLKKISAWYCVSCLAHVVWVILWQYEYLVVSLLAILALQGSLMALYWNVNRHVSSLEDQQNFLWLVKVPISIYLAWISITTMIICAIVLYALNWNGAGITPEFYTVFLCILATILGLVLLEKHHDFVFNLVIVWAFLGIGVTNRTNANVYIPVILLTIGILVALLHKERQILGNRNQ